MNKQNLSITVAASLVALAAVTGIGYMTYAQTSDTSDTANSRQGMRGWIEDILTDEQKAQIEAKREAYETEREQRRQEMQDAITSGYDAWKAKVTEERGEDAAILDEVTREEFAKFQEAHKYMAEGQASMEKARDLMEEIGVTGKGMMMGKSGMGKGPSAPLGTGMMGGRGGHMGGGMMGWGLDN